MNGGHTVTLDQVSGGRKGGYDSWGERNDISSKKKSSSRKSISKEKESLTSKMRENRRVDVLRLEKQKEGGREKGGFCGKN